MESLTHWQMKFNFCYFHLSYFFLFYFHSLYFFTFLFPSYKTHTKIIIPILNKLLNIIIKFQDLISITNLNVMPNLMGHVKNYKWNFWNSTNKNTTARWSMHFVQGSCIICLRSLTAEARAFLCARFLYNLSPKSSSNL